MTSLRDENGRQISLTARIGEGAEGAVWETDHTGIVAKVYHRPPDDERQVKLRRMPRLATRALMSCCAWPTGLLFDQTGRVIAGFLMPHATNFREIHQLHSPADRRRYFPNATWQFLWHVAMNCAAAFGEVHSQGHVIGDVNERSILVSGEGRVCLIDCDSFQIQIDGKRHRCVVGRPEYAPPELQGKNFGEVDRTTAHDSFALAIVVFQLLFMGRHPFAGRFQGSGEMPIEKAITEGKFAFGRHANRYLMAPPPNALPIEASTLRLAGMFEHAFDHRPSGQHRSTAEDWRAALQETKATLRPCGRDAAHLFPREVPDCPWCTIESQGGPVFFTSLTASFEFDAEYDIDAIWRRIQAVDISMCITQLRVTTGSDCVPKELPQNARIDLLGNEQSLPNPPVLRLQALPDLPTYVPLIDTIPPDPRFQSTPLPPKPQFVNNDRVAEAARAFKKEGTGSEYRIAKFGTLASILASVLMIPLGPFLLVPLVLLFAFSLNWLILWIPKRRAWLVVRDSAQASMQSEKKAFENHLAYWKTETARINALNCRRLVEHNCELNRLQELRRDALETEPGRLAAWPAELARVEAFRMQVKRENDRQEQMYRAELEDFEHRKGSIERHNSFVEQARRCYGREKESRRNNVSQARALKDQSRRSWEESVQKYRGEFQREKHELESAKQRYLALKSRFERDRQDLSANAREAQLNDHFRQNLIDDAKIQGIGARRKAVLTGYGIETAFDATEESLSGVPGFGYALIEALLSWREQVAGRFQFDHRRALPTSELRTIHSRCRDEKLRLRRRLLAGAEGLRHICERAHSELSRLQLSFDQASAQLAQAEVDVSVCRC